MIRKFEDLKKGDFDLLVIGGGVFGAWAAYDAALRGLKVALVEKGDWASGTSSASSKLIHGGLRYLEHFWFNVTRKSLIERRRLLALAPHRVFPLRFMLPIYKNSRVSRLKIGAGLSIYDHLARRGDHLGPFQYHTSRDMGERAPWLASEGLKGAFSYSDCQTDDARFVLEIISGAIDAGATAVNYAGVKSLIFSGKRVCGALVTDTLGNEEIELTAAVTLNAAGPWAWKLMENKAVKKPLLSKGAHLILPPLPGAEAALLTAPSDGRVIFLIPWYGATMLGTTDTRYDDAIDDVSVSSDDVAYLIDAANAYLNNTKWKASDVRGAFAGLRTLTQTGQENPSDVSRRCDILEPVENMLMRVGGKLTSARIEGADAIDRVMSILGRKNEGEPPTQNRPFPWRPDVSRDWQSEGMHKCRDVAIDEEVARNCVFRYGARLSELIDIIREAPDLSRRIQKELPFCRAEIVYAARFEMALTLKDILRRRIPLSIMSDPDDAILDDAAALAGRQLAWDHQKIKSEAAGMRR